MLNRIYKQFDKLVYKVNKTVVHHWKEIFFLNIHVKFNCDIFASSLTSLSSLREKKENSRDRKRKQNRIEFALLLVFTVIDLKVTSIRERKPNR